MKIRKFCCCFSLEFGAFVIGVVRLIWASVDGFSKITGGFSLLFQEYQNKAEAIRTIYFGIYILMAYGISSALLVSGVLKRQIESIQCYRYTARTTTCILFIVSIALIANTRAIFWHLKFTVSDAVLTLLYTAVEIYCLYVVGSLYGQLKAENQKEKDQRKEKQSQPYIITISDMTMSENIV
ncbi:hypothetical protein PVAND_016806 [Polypedilum vanderplanki]|uniref:Uncharacterized protein n=1 Tax=Polypedilum vanderplanki TaxID=319348 RepID=A0A9J6BHF1_POLVA|nr:hypothetical protein PVAND_016806 [Polypedilum vanderplanki]